MQLNTYIQALEQKQTQDMLYEFSLFIFTIGQQCVISKEE